LHRRNVRFVSKADMCGATNDVRFGPMANIIQLFDAREARKILARLTDQRRAVTYRTA
jgi:hypothetical protein